ncbi:MAG: family 43 glycosylhydrolase [Rikenellaceae bacterium]
MKRAKFTLVLATVLAMGSCAPQQSNCCESGELTETNAAPDLKSNYPKLKENLSSAMKRNLKYETEYPMENELYTTFKYTDLKGHNYNSPNLKGFDYNNGDGTISRRDPSKVIFENGKYYVWYTYRETKCPPLKGADVTPEIPAVDWDLSEIWYSTSTDGFTWEEQGVAVKRAPMPEPGSRSVSTADILKFEGKYYLYYQAFVTPVGKWVEECHVSVSVADSPDGPWSRLKDRVVSRGDAGEWDEMLIHDPFPMVHDGKIYLYYKSGYNHRDAGGLAIADRPEGPFRKCEKNPVLNSGHEVSLFPFREGVAAIVIKAGNEHNTIQYAPDWVNFEIASFVNILPNAPAGFINDAFTDTKDGRGITWGLCHFLNVGKDRNYSILSRFDCDLSLDVDDRGMKAQTVFIPREVYMDQKLSKAQLERIKRQNNALTGEK